MPCPECQGGMYGHEAWCSERKKSLVEDRTPYIIGTLHKFAMEGLPISLDPQRPQFKTIEECDAFWKRWIDMADDTLRRVADNALSSVPESNRAKAPDQN